MALMCINMAICKVLEMFFKAVLDVTSFIFLKSKYFPEHFHLNFPLKEEAI
jgi:hypothetical protein